MPPRAIRIDEHRYSFDDLPADVTRLLGELKRADRVISIRRDKVLLLRLGRRQLEERLRRGLESMPELEPHPEPVQTWTAQVSSD